jgi:hypothetical protein
MGTITCVHRIFAIWAIDYVLFVLWAMLFGSDESSSSFNLVFLQKVTFDRIMS